MKKVILSIALLSFIVVTAYGDATIDAVWFTQEIDCDGRDLVNICYYLSGGPAHVSAIMSADSGATWTVPMDSLIGAAGNIGLDVSSGSHCFDWVMSYDLPDTDGANWMIQVVVVSFLDTFAVIDSVNISSRPNYGWGLAFGDGKYWIYDYSSQYVYRADCVDPAVCTPTSIMNIGENNCDIDHDGDYIYYGKSGGNCDEIHRRHITTGADQKIADMDWFIPGASIQGVHVINDTLYAACYDNRFWVNKMFTLMFDLSRSFPITSWDTLLVGNLDDCHTYEGMTFACDYLWGSNNNGRMVRMDVDIPAYTGCYPIPNTGVGAEGLCWDGLYIWYQNRETDHIYQIMIYDSASSKGFAMGPLDSRTPSVSMGCPAELSVGESYTFHWSYYDNFFAGDPFEVIVHCGAVAETIWTFDTLFEYTVLPGCEILNIQIAVRDSFCNIGYAGCNVPIVSHDLLGYILIQGVDGIMFLRVVDQDDAISAANGIIMVQLPDFLGAADLVDTTAIDASPVFIETPYGIRSWRYDTEPVD